MGIRVVDLVELAVAGPNDVLPIEDLAAGKTKKIKVANLTGSGAAAALTRADATPVPITIDGNIVGYITPDGACLWGASVAFLGSLPGGVAYIVADGFVLWNSGSPAAIASISGGTMVFGDNSIPTKFKGNTLTFELNGATVVSGSGTAVAFGHASKQIEMLGGLKRAHTNVGANFTASQFVEAYTLSADTLTITLDSSLPVGTTHEFWVGTYSNAPGHTLAPNGGATIGGSNTPAAASITWPAGVTRVTVRLVGAGVWLASW